MSGYVALGNTSGEITEKKSRFIGSVYEIHSEEEAARIIEQTRKQYWDARHNCYAYVLGPKDEIQRFSDDKEPSGTAGRPILDVLLGSEIHNALIIVTRYFGGVLLGTGGLVRAYTDSSLAAVAALKEAGRLLPVKSGRMITFSCDYKDISAFESLAVRYDMRSISKDYLDKAIYKMVIEGSNADKFMEEARNITRGSFSPESDVSVWYCENKQDAIIYNWQ